MIWYPKNALWKILTYHLHLMILCLIMRLMDNFAEKFNQFFQDKVTNIKCELDKYPCFEPENEAPAEFLSFIAVTEEEVGSIIKKSKPTNCCLDPIPTRLIKGNSQILVSLITRMVSISLSSGTYHKSWKWSTIIPLLKKKNLDQVLINYRQIRCLIWVSWLKRPCSWGLMSIWMNIHYYLTTLVHTGRVIVQKVF